MLSFHGKEEIKKKYIVRVSAHIKADNLIRGTGWNGNKGCAVGCTLENYDHAEYEKQLGIPEWLARLEDSLFEGMSLKKSATWPRDFLKAIKVGVNLEPIKYKFAVYLLKENIDRVLTLNIENDLKEKVISAIRQVLIVNESAIYSGELDASAASAARSAARSAASAARSAESAASAERSAASAESAERSAAMSAASAASAAWSAAWSAARSAESAESAASAAMSAASAAWSAARSAESAAASAAWSAASAAYNRHASYLLKLLKSM